MPFLTKSRVLGKVILSLIEKSKINPSSLRSSVKKPIPCLSASKGFLIISSSSFYYNLTRFYQESIFKNLLISVRPAPIKPETKNFPLTYIERNIRKASPERFLA